MGCVSGGGPGILGTRAHHDWNTRFRQALHTLLPLFIGQERPIAHGPAIDHGAHAGFNQLLGFVHQGLVIGIAIAIAGRHEGWDTASEDGVLGIAHG